MSMENLIGKPLPESTPEKFIGIELKNKDGFTIAWLRYPDVLQLSNTLLSVQDARDMRDYLNKIIPPSDTKTVHLFVVDDRICKKCGLPMANAIHGSSAW